MFSKLQQRHSELCFQAVFSQFTLIINRFEVVGTQWREVTAGQLTCCLWWLGVGRPKGRQVWAWAPRWSESTGQEVCVCRCIWDNAPLTRCTTPHTLWSAPGGKKKKENRFRLREKKTTSKLCSTNKQRPLVCAAGRPWSSSARLPWSLFPRWEGPQWPCGHEHLWVAGENKMSQTL